MKHIAPIPPLLDLTAKQTPLQITLLWRLVLVLLSFLSSSFVLCDLIVILLSPIALIVVVFNWKEKTKSDFSRKIGIEHGDRLCEHSLIAKKSYIIFVFFFQGGFWVCNLSRWCGLQFKTTAVLNCSIL